MAFSMQRSLPTAQQRPRAANRSCRRTIVAQAAAAPASQAKIIDGKKIAEDIRKEIAAEVAQLKEKTGKASCSP